ncbi:Beta-lactamase-like protein 2 [Choanephora cucurbitarum]|uniref:Beta-lactamase-like protein 2 n=1 Tax=Choanephora cucurbitarum TaxID=101091 RepID=A0A1C7N273_9FUNG|nr:Beta-lactamase-like protein 2 [Choanephora cucurbitarum]
MAEASVQSNLPVLPDFEQLSDRVWRLIYLHQTGTNTYLVGLGQRKVLIDCGDGHPGYVPLLIRSLQSIHPNAYISDILISHGHKDHWGGLNDILTSELNKNRKIQVHKYPLSEDARLLKYMTTFPTSAELIDLEDGQLFEIDQDTHVRVMHTPGHCEDHCSFYLEQEKVLFTADCILGHGSVAFDDLKEYMNSLQHIRNLNPGRLYPGHGQVVEDSLQKIDQYFSMRLAKEKLIIDTMIQNKDTPMSAYDIVEATSNNAKKKLEGYILISAAIVIGLHLIKLFSDGKAELVHPEEFVKAKGIDPYNSANVVDILHEKWRYIGDIHTISKL